MTFKIISGGGALGSWSETIEHTCEDCRVTFRDHSRCSKRCVKCRIERNRVSARERGRRKKALKT